LNATSSAAASPLHWRTGLLLFLAVVALALPQAALLPLLDRDEPRFAEASREMLQSGEYAVPTFNHAPRYAKPPLIYWCQTVAFTLFGENAFAARLPSLLATAGTAWLIAAWGASFGRIQMGLGAGLCYALCLQTIQQGRVATADALLIYFMTLTAYAGWRVLTELHVSHSTRSYRWDTLLALGFAGGFLAKGPEAFLPLAPLLYCARGMGRRVIGEILVNFVIGVVIVLFWAVPAYIKTNGDYWRIGLSEGVGQRMVSGLQGHGTSGLGGYLLFLPYYFVLFWLGALPWSPLLLIRARKLFSGWKPDRADTYLLLNAGLIFFVFTLMVTKLPHYTLPAFPFLALFFARRWNSTDLEPTLPTKLAARFGVAFTVLTLILVPIALANHATPSPVGELVRAAGADLKPDTQFVLVDFEEPNTIWEMRRVAAGSGQTIPPGKVLSFLNQAGSHAVILSTDLWQKLKPSADSTWKTFQAQGINAAKLNIRKPYYLPRPQPLDLTLVVKP
jgi:4-amino-4-deoxy-L-arabinose transferase-like glycosyltransferase